MTSVLSLSKHPAMIVPMPKRKKFRIPQMMATAFLPGVFLVVILRPIFLKMLTILVNQNTRTKAKTKVFV